MKSAVIGFPRIGELRELKFTTEKYFRKEIDEKELEEVAKNLRLKHWKLQKDKVDFVSSNDFSFYDSFLDTAVLIGAIPNRYKELNLSPLDTYFSMARGYQGEAGDVKALAMKKWFNTNYHYMQAELDKDTVFEISSNKPFDEYIEAKEAGFDTKPVIIGPFTFLKLAKIKDGKCYKDFVDSIIKVYKDVIVRFVDLGTDWLQIDEPALVMDLNEEEVDLFQKMYSDILSDKKGSKILLQTYFGDVRDCYEKLISLDFDGIGLDFLEGEKTLDLIKTKGFPNDKILFAGLVNGKNIWKCNYEKVLEFISSIREVTDNIVLSTSSSLLHVPFTLENEHLLKNEVKRHLAFAKEKLQELKELVSLAEEANYQDTLFFKENKEAFEGRKKNLEEVSDELNSIEEKDFVRLPSRKERLEIQKKSLSLPELPTTTIGSFPQTSEVKKNRSLFKKGEISKEEYDKNIYSFIKDCIDKQEEIGLDVLVHGEFERNDMVEFFGENLEGYIFTEKAWVQSYGSRCVKPPIIFDNIRRKKAISLDYTVYAQNLTKKPVKGMLTGPVTILNWSFPREDVSLDTMAYQIAVAIREEVLDLEKAGIKVIQIDEAALKEKLPIRRQDWYSKYLDWAIKSFRLCHSKVKESTQIHTHMCYSEFEDIIEDIDNMDADVISFEASRSDFYLLKALKEKGFETEVGPGIYDIHSPRIPSVEELVTNIKSLLENIDKNSLWINPDCGLKTRNWDEAYKSLKNLVTAKEEILNK